MNDGLKKSVTGTQKCKNEIITSSILGFMVGDALGVPVEFKTRKMMKNKPVTKMEEYGTYYQPKGTWSDDSSMILAEIDVIINDLENHKFNLLKKMMDAFVEWKEKGKYTPFNQVFDIGNLTKRAIDHYEMKLKDYPKINNDEDIIKLISCGYDHIYANGNGSLMRILPISFYCYYLMNEEESTDFIFLVSSLTHAHIYSKMSCLIYSKYISFLLQGYDKKNAYIKLQEWYSSKYNELNMEVFDRIMKNNIEKFSENEIKSSGYVIDSLEAVFWSILNTNNYKEAVLKAVNLGDDTDTIGALTGGIAGIIYGLDEIPKEWLDSLQKKDEISIFIDKFSKKIEEERVKYSRTCDDKTMKLYEENHKIVKVRNVMSFLKIINKDK